MRNLITREFLHCPMCSMFWIVYHKKTHVQWNQNIRGLLSRSLLHLIYFQWSSQGGYCFFQSTELVIFMFVRCDKVRCAEVWRSFVGFLVSDEFWHKSVKCLSVNITGTTLRHFVTPSFRAETSDAWTYCESHVKRRASRSVRAFVESVVQNVSWIR